ncbi:Protein TIC110, chloroplastic [Linum perenne]
MNPSLLSVTPSSSSAAGAASPALLSPFLIRSNPSSLSLPSRRRLRVSFPRNSAASAVTVKPSDESASTATQPKPSIFGERKELTGIQPLVGSLPPPVRLTCSVIVLAGAVAAGYGLGQRFGGTRNLAIGGAAAMGAAGGAMVYALNACVPEVAATSLHNYVVGLDDPKGVEKDEIEQIVRKYGVSKTDQAFSAELSDLYCRFVSSVLPPGSQELKGNEVETIINFKNALGIDDPDAAAMHLEIGRRIFRQRLETGDREGDTKQRRAFQKLVYVSSLVFGDASSFLLPWKRVFKVTDSQVEVAIRDNAQRLYASKLRSVGRDIDAEQLISLRETQLAYGLSDELAKDLFQSHARKLMEENISAAVDILKTRSVAASGLKQAVDAIDAVLAFNDRLISFKDHADADRYARGVGPISVLGGEYDVDRKMDQLKLLYKAYVTDALSGGRMEDSKVASLDQLRSIFGLGTKQSETIMHEVTSKVYRKRLGQAFTGGDLEMADSKAAFLQNLCEELRFDPLKAKDVHADIYRQKLQQCLADGELSEADVKSLLRVRVMLCIPEETVEAAHTDICGTLFSKAVMDLIGSGADGYNSSAMEAVKKAAHRLKLSREAAMTIASRDAKKVLMTYVKRARSAEDRAKTAEQLKKLVYFNHFVLTRLVAGIKGESSDDKPKDLVKEETIQTEGGWESLASLKKMKYSGEAAPGAEPGQTEINLKDDLPLRDRTDLFRKYLIFCLSGQVQVLPFGASSKPSDSEFVFLCRLGEILGLTDEQIVDVHKEVAEITFKKQAEVILADGQLTKSKVDQLEDVRKQIGYPEEHAQKAIKDITSTKMATVLETAIGKGKIDIKQIRELKESNVDIEKMISEKLRNSLFKKTVEEIFSSGSGEFDEVEVYEKLPADLNINAEKSKEVVHQLARNRLSNSLIQAVAQLRQRNHAGVVSALNNMVAADKAVPAEAPLNWEVAQELDILYTVYLRSDPAAEKLSRVQYLLGISDTAADALREIKHQPLSSGAAEEEEEKFVF